MSSDHKAWSLAMLLACIALVSCVAIMARCSVDTTRAEQAAAQCGARGGTWHSDPTGPVPFCEEKAK